LENEKYSLPLMMIFQLPLLRSGDYKSEEE